MIIIADIVDRLLWRKPQWYHGEPEVRVEGTQGGFGKLVFDFRDEIVVYRLYFSQPPSVVKRLADLAIVVFPDMARRLFEQDQESSVSIPAESISISGCDAVETE